MGSKSLSIGTADTRGFDGKRIWNTKSAGHLGCKGPAERANRDELFGFFEERQTGAFVFGHDVAFRKGIDCAGAWGGGEIVKGDGGSATEGLLAAVEEVGFSVFLAGAAEWHRGFSFGCTA